jgi:hypothetical protein
MVRLGVVGIALRPTSRVIAAAGICRMRTSRIVIADVVGTVGLGLTDAYQPSAITLGRVRALEVRAPTESHTPAIDWIRRYRTVRVGLSGRGERTLRQMMRATLRAQRTTDRRWRLRAVPGAW